MDKLRIILDPGHGGENIGCVSKDGRLVEKVWTLHFCRRLRATIAALDMPLDVRLARNDDSTIDLRERGWVAEEWQTDLVLSIHVNSFEDDRLQGARTFYWPNNVIGREAGDAIIRSVPHPLYTRKRVSARAESMRRADDQWMDDVREVLGAYRCTSVLLEAGFASHPLDLESMLCEQGRLGLELACINGLLRFWQLVRPGVSL